MFGKKEKPITATEVMASMGNTLSAYKEKEMYLNYLGLGMQAPTFTPNPNPSPSPMPTLPTRRDVTVVDEIDLGGLDRELANEAAELLGYTTAQGHINKVEAAAKLAKLLKDLDIRPFVKDEVKAYQARVRAANTSTYTHAWWKSRELGGTDGYNMTVPQFVLHTALRVKKACPEIKLNVEYLDVNPADPFLIVSLDGISEYIEFWDEADFNGKRQA